MCRNPHLHEKVSAPPPPHHIHARLRDRTVKGRMDGTVG